jgi:hypothetical protein
LLAELGGLEPSAQCAGLVPWRYVKGSHGFDEQISGANEQIPERGQTYLSGIGLKVI